MGRDTLKLGPLEMEVIGLLEGKTAFSVQEIQGQLKSQDKKLAYTTVMTILSRLFEKGVLKREKIGRQFYYSLANKGERLRTGVFATVYQSLFKSDRLKPIINLLSESENLSSEELEQLRDLIDEKLKICGDKP